VFRRLAASALAFLAIAAFAAARTAQPAPRTVQFVFTSDAHYGLSRPFHGRSHVGAHEVNAALVAAINALPQIAFPRDSGLRAGEKVGSIDFVAEGGDVANREEADGAIQPAAASWQQFVSDYIDGLTVLDDAGPKAPVLVVPGNHEASNAVGWWKPMAPPTDPTAIVGIYNLMMRPETRTNSTYRYASDPVLTSRDIAGVHFVFVQVWPDSRARRWMDGDLARVSGETPVVIFTHDQPDVEAKHLGNPNGTHDVNGRDRFENLLVDSLRDGTTIDSPTLVEQRELESFVTRHANLVAYFHGNSNWNEFYEWKGPSQRLRLHTFRVDSPMKGAESASDETRLSFQVVTMNVRSRQMTVRECLWNAAPDHLVWGESASRALAAGTFTQP
jgi:hypothetical protein